LPFGASEAVAIEVHFATITGLIDAIAKEGAPSFYLEILAKHGHRRARPIGTGDAPQTLD